MSAALRNSQGMRAILSQAEDESGLDVRLSLHSRVSMLDALQLVQQVSGTMSHQ